MALYYSLDVCILLRNNSILEQLHRVVLVVFNVSAEDVPELGGTVYPGTPGLRPTCPTRSGQDIGSLGGNVPFDGDFRPDVKSALESDVFPCLNFPEAPRFTSHLCLLFNP